jgi:hypothetical protein
LGEFFMVYDIDTHQLNLREILKFKDFGWNSIQKMCCFAFFLVMNAQ